MPVGLLDKVVLTLPRGKHDELQTDVTLNSEIVAPLAVGDAVGMVTVTLDGETRYQAPAVALQAVEPSGFFARLWDSILMFIAELFGAGRTAAE